MPATPRKTVLCRYHYDPLDRLVDCVPSAEAGIQRFYCKSRLATEIQGAVQRSVFQHDDQLLAKLRREDAEVGITLLATDQQRSVLNVLDATGPHPLAYTAYGHRPAENGLLSLLGFNGERPDPVTGHYLLGNGYRAFNPVLMRFNSPDSWSPFGEGGLNAYAYCGGDPRNLADSTGHAPNTPVRLALAAFREQKEQLSRTSRAISKPSATKREVASTASSSKRGRQSRFVKTYRSDMKELSHIINKNEEALPNQNKTYNITSQPTDRALIPKGYDDARRLYNFDIYPDPNIIRIVKYANGPEILDVLPYDAAIYYFRQPADESSPFPRSTLTAQRLIILRALNIKLHTGLDLMKIRQETS